MDTTRKVAGFTVFERRFAAFYCTEIEKRYYRKLMNKRAPLLSNWGSFGQRSNFPLKGYVGGRLKSPT